MVRIHFFFFFNLFKVFLYAIFEFETFNLVFETVYILFDFFDNFFILNFYSFYKF